MLRPLVGAGLLAAIVLAATGCSLLPTGNSTADATKQFEQYVEQSGSNEVTALDVAVTNGSWFVKVEIQAPGQPRQRWSQDGVEAVEGTGAGRAMSTSDFETQFAALSDRISTTCGGDGFHGAGWELTPSGAELGYVNCQGGSGPTYTPGSATLDGQPVADSYDSTDPNSVAAAIEVFSKVFAAGELTKLSAPPLSLGGLQATGSPDGSCSPILVLEDTPSPLGMGCASVQSDGQPFDLATFDPAAIASVREQAAAQVGVPITEIQGIEYTSPDGVNLDVRLWYGSGQWLSATIAPR